MNEYEWQTNTLDRNKQRGTDWNGCIPQGEMMIEHTWFKGACRKGTIETETK